MAKDAPAKSKAPKARGGTEKAKKEKKVKDPNAPKVSVNSHPLRPADTARCYHARVFFDQTAGVDVLLAHSRPCFFVFLISLIFFSKY